VARRLTSLIVRLEELEAAVLPKEYVAEIRACSSPTRQARRSSAIRRSAAAPAERSSLTARDTDASGAQA